MASEAPSQAERLMLVENAALGHEGLKNALWAMWSWSHLTEIRPTYDAIAERMNSSRRTAIRHLQRLAQMGIVTKQQRWREDESGTSNMYEIDFGALAHYQISDRYDPGEDTADNAFVVRPEHLDKAGPKVIAAAEWLQQALANGLQRATELRKQAGENCITPRTLDRAKSRLGVVASNEGMIGGVWYWAMPEPKPPLRGREP